MSDEVIAILVSDVHLSHKPPVFRSNEPDWYATMAGYLKQVCDLQYNHYYTPPVVIAGDIFDRWNSPSELVNFAIKQFRPMSEVVAIPGQHDLPNHSLKEIERSSYWTLVESEAISHMGDIRLNGAGYFRGGRLNIYGFPWNCDFYDLHDNYYKPTFEEGKLKVAVIHSYVWTENYGFYNAPDEKLLDNYLEHMYDYDVLVFGDNHKGFIINGQKSVCNTGAFMIRKSDEFEYRPFVGLLMSDGKVAPHYLNTSNDVYLDKEDAIKLEHSVELDNFVQVLQEAQADSLDFRETMERGLDESDLNECSRGMVYKAMGD